MPSWRHRHFLKNTTRSHREKIMAKPEQRYRIGQRRGRANNLHCKRSNLIRRCSGADRWRDTRRRRRSFFGGKAIKLSYAEKEAPAGCCCRWRERGTWKKKVADMDVVQRSQINRRKLLHCHCWYYDATMTELNVSKAGHDSSFLLATSQLIKELLRLCILLWRHCC